MAAIVNAEKIAQALNLTESRVHQLVKEGLPKEGRGQYDAVKCIRWYIVYLQNAIEKTAAPALDGVFAGEQRERVRLMRAAADGVAWILCSSPRLRDARDFARYCACCEISLAPFQRGNNQQVLHQRRARGCFARVAKVRCAVRSR